MSASEDTQAEQSNLIPWKPGQSGNPAGRPKGARNKLAESFLADVLSEWETHGATAISDMREKNPADFCKMVASLLPKDVNLNVNNLSELSDDELLSEMRKLHAGLAPILAQGMAAEAGDSIPSQLH
jgi:hypothetical protein